MKKLTSIFLAMVMIFALAIPALAEEDKYETELELEYEYGGLQEEMTIKINLPGTADIVLNPYKMEHSDAGGNIYIDKLADQVFSIPQTIKSRSNVALNVVMKVTGNPEGVTLVAQDAVSGDNVTAKNVYLEMQYGLTTDEGLPPTEATMIQKQITASEITLDGNNAVQIPLASDTAPKYFSIVFTGAANPKPSEAYTEDDKVGVTIAYTFVPVMSAIPQIKVATKFDTSTNITATIPDYDSYDFKADEPATVSSPTEGVTIAANTGAITVDKDKFVTYTEYTAAKKTDKDFVVVLPVTFTNKVVDNAEANPVTYKESAPITVHLRIVCAKAAS